MKKGTKSKLYILLYTYITEMTHEKTRKSLAKQPFQFFLIYS
jgi:hypothetical protein